MNIQIMKLGRKGFVGILSAIACLLLAMSSSAQTQTFNSSGTFNVPLGVTSVTVECWGGGGSGGGSTNATGFLEGRGGGGGAGGAYAIRVITLAPGTTTLSVVVAGQTAGTVGANGSQGASSTITGFESQIFAAGGAGGTGNTAGGSPAGGVGTTSGSFGTTVQAGVTGGAGATSITAGSGAGGAGAHTGGAGGAALTALSGTVNGNNGTAPGGGGSGAHTSTTGGSRTGGTGAAGRVIITWVPVTCLTSLTSAVGTNTQSVCKNIGIVNITYSLLGATNANVSGLPTGVGFSVAGNTLTISGVPTISNASPFSYTVTPVGTCSFATATGTITVFELPVATVTDQSNISCFAAGDGTITATASGGNGTYTYSINGGTLFGPTTQTTHTYTSLLPNTAYHIKVTDGHSCVSK